MLEKVDLMTMFHVIPSFGSTAINQKTNIKFKIKLEATVSSKALIFILISKILIKPFQTPNKIPVKTAKKTE